MYPNTPTVDYLFFRMHCREHCMIDVEIPELAIARLLLIVLVFR